MTEFRSLLELLVSNQIEFIVIGGAAATAHGSSRLTRDLDVVYRRSPENIARLVRAVGSHRPYLRGAPPGLPFRWDVETVKKGLNFTLETNLGNLDLLGEVTGGGTYEQILPHSERKRIYDIECLCLKLKPLIEVKRAAGRPKDFDAIAELEVIWNHRKKSSSSEQA